MQYDTNYRIDLPLAYNILKKKSWNENEMSFNI